MKCAQQVEEAPLLEHALEHDLQLRQMRVGAALSPVDRAPGLEPLPPGGERADARLHAVGDDQQRVVGEERRDLRLVGLELLERRPDRGVLVGRVLELDHRQRQAVDEQHDVRPAGVLVLDDGELVDGQPVVVVRRRRSRCTRACAPRIEPSAARYSTVTPSTSIRCTARLRSISVGAFGPRQLAEGVVQRLGGQPRLSRASASRSRCSRTTWP